MADLIDMSQMTVDIVANIGERIAAAMRDKLRAAGHIDTGALYDSIHQETETTADGVQTTIYANAASEDGTQYAEFIELGSGIYRPGGRTEPWRYKDRDGNWHTTSGMQADPFISPSVDEVLTDDAIADIVDSILYNLELYGKGDELHD